MELQALSAKSAKVRKTASECVAEADGRLEKLKREEAILSPEEPKGKQAKAEEGVEQEEQPALESPELTKERVALASRKASLRARRATCQLMLLRTVDLNSQVEALVQNVLARQLVTRGPSLVEVVNNFVSGLIMLVERPVSTGDWIVVGGSEGYVKRISIRSTTLQTFDRADVIVPNSELISGQVTNWMLRGDLWGRIKVPVGVAYGSDTAKVKDALLEIASKHPEVIRDNPGISDPYVVPAASPRICRFSTPERV